MTRWMGGWPETFLARSAGTHDGGECERGCVEWEMETSVSPAGLNHGGGEREAERWIEVGVMKSVRKS